MLGLEIGRTAAEEFTIDALLRSASVTFARREELLNSMRAFAPSLLRTTLHYAMMFLISDIDLFVCVYVCLRVCSLRQQRG